MIEEKTDYDERDKTLEYMNSYGYEKVRGYAWCREKILNKPKINNKNNKEKIEKKVYDDTNIRNMYVVENKDNGMLYILDAYFNNEECLECGTPPKKSKCSDFQKILHKYVHLMEISHRRTIRDTLEKYKFVCGDVAIEPLFRSRPDPVGSLEYHTA